MSVTLRLPFMVLRRLIVPSTCQLSSTPVRCKEEKELLDLEEDDEIALSLKKAKIISSRIGSMRLDYVIKAGLGISRNKVDVIFYDSRVLRNGKKAIKKSTEVRIGDVIDVINTDRAPPNPQLINVSRLKIIDAELEKDVYTIKMIRDKNLIIEDENKKF